MYEISQRQVFMTEKNLKNVYFKHEVKDGLLEQNDMLKHTQRGKSSEDNDDYDDHDEINLEVDSKCEQRWATFKHKQIAGPAIDAETRKRVRGL